MALSAPIWDEPLGERERLRRLMMRMYGKLAPELNAKLLEPDADYLQALTAARNEIISWIETTLGERTAGQ